MDASRIAKSDRLPLTHRLAIGYLALPLAVWLVGWLEWWVGIPATAALALALGNALRGPWRRRKSPLVGVVLLVALVWVLVVPAGGVFRSLFGDWTAHRAVLLDLSRGSWPTYLVDHFNDRPPLLLRYYLGYYMVPALFGKWFGQTALNWAVPLWTWAGTGLLCLLFVRGLATVRAVAIALAVLVFFGGLDVIEYVVRRMLFDVGNFSRLEILGWAMPFMPSSASPMQLEFQSGHDADMAWRMRDYLHVVESGLRQTGTARAEGAVPDMLSIVLHNGERPWRAATECAGPLTGDGPPVLVRMYATVDLRMLARGRDGEGRKLAPGSRLATLAELESAPAELRRGLHLRVEAALARRGVVEGLPPLAACERMLAARRGEDMTAMLDATLARWEEAKVAEGVERGLAEGVERGLAEGVERGLAEGRVALLRRQARWRFGTDVADQVTALLVGATDVSLLDEAAEWLLECDTGEALLARLRAGGNGAGNNASG